MNDDECVHSLRDDGGHLWLFDDEDTQACCYCGTTLGRVA